MPPTTVHLTSTSIAERTALYAACAREFADVLRATPLHAARGRLPGPARLARKTGLGMDNRHFPMNLSALLRLGLPGIERTARENAAKTSGEESVCLAAIAEAYAAAREFARAQGCPVLSERAPANFVEAVSLFWLTWAMRGRGTVGRLDQHLQTFYRADIDRGTLTHEDALDLLVELWEHMNEAEEGDTLANVMLGGQDAAGRDATSDLSLLMLDAALAVRRPEPHLNVRLHAGAPREFLDKVVELHLLGHGQGTVFYDEAVIPSLTDAGIPPETARNYSNDGCSEIVLDGESTIRLVMMEALKTLELTLFNGGECPRPGPAEGRYWHRAGPVRPLKTSLVAGLRTGDLTAMASFESFYEAYWAQYRAQLDRKLDDVRRQIDADTQRRVSSPFLAGTFPQCLATGRDLLRGGVSYPLTIVFSGSFGTVVDALAAVRKVVYEDKACSPRELLDALRADFAGHEALRRRLLAAPKYGTDAPEVDALAADLSRRFCGHVRHAPAPPGHRFWPALFDHLFNDHAKLVAATPDGRRWQEPVSEHCSPTPGRARRGPTAVMRSAARLPLRSACGTAVLQLVLSRSAVTPDALRQLLLTGRDLGLPVLNVALYDVRTLRDAQAHPERHADLLVRVWGYSARFVELSRDMQDVIIARAEEPQV